MQKVVIKKRKNIKKKPGLIFESWFFCCPFNEKCSAKNLLDDQEVKQHQQAKDDAIPSEDLEVVFFDILHQEFDNDDWWNECSNQTDDQNQKFSRWEDETEFQQLEQWSAEHDRDCQEERELCGNGSWNAKNQGPDDRCAWTRRSRENSGNQLEETDQNNRIVWKLGKRIDFGALVFVNRFDPNERDPENNQRNRNADRVVEKFFKRVVESNADDAGWKAGNHDFDPHDDDVLVDIAPNSGRSQRARLPAFMERPDFVPVDDDNGHDGSNLNDDFKHAVKWFWNVQFDKLIKQDHMPRAADRKPFGDAFNDTEQEGFD